MLLAEGYQTPIKPRQRTLAGNMRYLIEHRFAAPLWPRGPSG